MFDGIERKEAATELVVCALNGASAVLRPCMGVASLGANYPVYVEAAAGPEQTQKNKKNFYLLKWFLGEIPRMALLYGDEEFPGSEQGVGFMRLVSMQTELSSLSAFEWMEGKETKGLGGS